jgi:hypothetical protein
MVRRFEGGQSGNRNFKNLVRIGQKFGGLLRRIKQMRRSRDGPRRTLMEIARDSSEFQGFQENLDELYCSKLN